jgi:protein-disulfide isomerase
VVILARFGVISLGLFFCLALIPGCKAQSAGATPAGAAAGLDQEVARRIRLEIRSRYNVPPQVDIAVGAPAPSDIPGYEKVVVTFSGGSHSSTHDFLLSKDHKTLAHLETIDISQDLMSKIDVKGRPVRGDAAAKVVIINYDDFQCPFCSRMHAALFPGLYKTYGDKVKIIYKDYPLVEIHPWAMHAAIDANCLGEQNGSAYWDFADYVHGNQKVIAGRTQQEAFNNLDAAATDQVSKYHLDAAKAQACIKQQDDTAVRASMAEGDKLGVDSTPTLFVNGERLSGAVPEEQMRAIIERALAEAGQPAAAAKK